MNVGLAIGAGAAAGLVGGAVGFGGPELGLDPYTAYFAGAASGGSVASTIMGSDPGEGALYAIAAAGLALGVQYAYNKYQQYQAAKAYQAAHASNIDQAGKVIPVGSRECTGGYDCYGVNLEVSGTENGASITISRTGAQRAGPSVPLELYWSKNNPGGLTDFHKAKGLVHLKSFSLGPQSTMTHITDYSSGYVSVYGLQWQSGSGGRWSLEGPILLRDCIGPCQTLL